MKRFFDKVNKTKGGCWLWIGCTRGKTGYGAFKFNGKVVDAHRFSYILHKGHIPEKMLVCHTCDNRLCVNPDHLKLGTYYDNFMDAVSKGRIKILPPFRIKKHPSQSAYRKGCRCAGCRIIHTEISRQYRIRKNLKSFFITKTNKHMDNEKATPAEETYPHTVTGQDLANNPELAEAGVKEGDEIGIPVNPDSEAPKNEAE